MRTDLTRGLLSSVVAIVAIAPAAAEQFNVEANVIHQGCCIDTSSGGGASPTSTAVPLSFSHDGKTSGLANASSGRGQVTAAGGSASNGGKVTSIGTASATFDDVLFTFTGSGPAPQFVPHAALFYEVAANQTASGALGTLGGFNGREVDYSVAFNGSAESGKIVWDVAGDSGQGLLGGHQLASVQVPIDRAVSVHLEILAGAQATLKQVGSPVNTGINAVLQIGQATVAAAAPQGFALRNSFAAAAFQPLAPVFDLPDEFTVNSVSMGVVNNRWIFAPIPEPSSWALALVAQLRWRRRSGPV